MALGLLLVPLLTGIRGLIALFAGVLVSFLAGAVVAVGFGYTCAVDITTIAAGAVTYIVGPVTGATLGASSEVIALSIAAGLVKSILTMVVTPMVARMIGLDNPRSAMIFGGLIGTTSGVAAGLAATDARLVPYGAMTATFYTGLGILLAPTVLFLAGRLFFQAGVIAAGLHRPTAVSHDQESAFFARKKRYSSRK